VFQTIDQSKKALNAFEQDSTLVVIVELSQSLGSFLALRQELIDILSRSLMLMGTDYLR